MRPRALALVAVLSLAVTGCAAPGVSTEAESPASLQRPTFAALETAADDVASPTPGSTDVGAAGMDDATETAPSAVASPSPSPTSTNTATPSPSAGPERPQVAEPRPTTGLPADTTSSRRRGTLPDGTGDMRGLGADGAPNHADLRRLTLEVTDDTARLRVAFAAPAPETGDGDHILNVATYHDVTGDGHIDYEIWASLTSDGWGTAWFDIREDTARFAAEDDVDVEVVNGVVVLTFPPSHLGGARSGRWFASSEWGTAVDMSAGSSANDDAPDDRTGRAWRS